MQFWHIAYVRPQGFVSLFLNFFFYIKNRYRIKIVVFSRQNFVRGYLSFFSS